MYPFEQIANRGSSGLASGAGLESALNPTELRLGFIPIITIGRMGELLSALSTERATPVRL